MNELDRYTRTWGATAVPFGPLSEAQWIAIPFQQRALSLLDQTAALRGAMLLSGGNGVGKSTLVGRWVRQLEHRLYTPVNLTQATLSSSGLLAILARSLGKRGSQRRERNLDELSCYLAAPLFEKAHAIGMESAAERRELLTDSLLIEADQLCRSVRERNVVMGRLRNAIAALEPFHSSDADAWRQRLTAALNNPSTQAISQMTAAALEWCDAEVLREEAVLRREAVLKALSALGYEVREGKETAWAVNGRVVVRKPSEPNYGVELASPPVGPGVQARVVAFCGPNRSSRNVQRDREVELTWCNEFQQARELLNKDGFNPTLLHSTPAGKLPVKAIPITEAESTHQKAQPKLQRMMPKNEDL